ncbi:ECF RNA polymerase sigma factor SigE [compost metagenome]
MKRRSRSGAAPADFAAAAWDHPSDPDLQAAVRGLDPKYRQIVILMYFEGYTLTEIASLLDLPSGTVKTRLHKALQELRRHLGEGEDAHG